MTSAIDATKPVAGSPTTQSVRDNFATAKSEITALQAAGPYVPLAGGTISGTAPGSLTVNRNAAAVRPDVGTAIMAQFNAADGVASDVVLDGFATNFISLKFRRANGTCATPLQIATNDILGAVTWNGFGTTAYNTSAAARIQAQALEAFTDSVNHGAQLLIQTSAAGSAASTAATFDGGGNLQIFGATATKPGGGSWVAPSDPALKIADTITPYTDGLDALLQLEPIRYAYNGRAGTPDDGRQYVGLDAEAAAASMPSLVGEMTYQPTAPNEEGEPVPEGAPETYRTVDPSELVFTLINAVRELSDRLAALEAASAPAAR